MLSKENIDLKQKARLASHFASDVEKQTMADTMIISPIGKKSKLNSWKEDILQSKTLNEEGTYLIISGNKGGFYTKTTDGKSEKKPKN